ncbi:winged helix family two component transcriptional regulator [Paraburkholderia silvatlantica]|nr:winged helix family two component transcriptional regulator [Paraburkholderia silvatlantica]PXW23783.1 winged helix family two component transcriptional regulator [Paraburkholderia silvatlantica]TDQ98935.1 winged helix family two component transcriptional regulator [Paraburkholderia silvatlantica]
MAALITAGTSSPGTHSNHASIDAESGLCNVPASSAHIMPNVVPRVTDTRQGRIIVLDDEAVIRNMLQRYLVSHGFEVRAVRNGMQLATTLERHSYDLLILDVMMPDEDGLSICKRLRAQGETLPILMLTARGDPVDRVIGLELGADDYLTKPFLPNELLARVRAILRRRDLLMRQLNAIDGAMPGSETAVLRFGPFRLDVGRQTLHRDDNLKVEIGNAEMRLLCALALTPNRPVSRAKLIERARGPDSDASGRIVDMQVWRIRQIIEIDASSPSSIRTVWGVGYMLVAEFDA